MKSSGSTATIFGSKTAQEGENNYNSRRRARYPIIKLLNGPIMKNSQYALHNTLT